MRINELLENKNLKLLSENVDTSVEIEGVFVGDLLSWVMGNSEPKQAWITVQAHNNVIAVAGLREFSCVIVCHGAEINNAVIAQATTEGIPLLSTDLSAFDTCRTLIEMGL